MTGNHEGLLEHSVTRKAFLQYAKSLFAKKKVLKIFWACCIVLTLQGGGVKEGVKGEKTKVCHVET